MVKCPTATPSQMRANLAHFHRTSSVNVEPPELQAEDTEEDETLVPETDEFELDSNKADKRSKLTPKDDLVYFFISCFLDILLERWEGKPCYKTKFKVPSAEVYGEDLGPCEMSDGSSKSDFLKELYQKRSKQLSKEKEYTAYTESSASEIGNEEELETINYPDIWKKPTPDEDVYFQFKNGVWYKGRVSRRLMEGEGYYFCGDGTTFQGEFEDGCLTGRGRLEFSDLSVYEGDVYKAFRHGEGMFCFSDSPVMYSGQWWLGKKHGHGLIVYSGPSETPSFYKGQWQDGMKEGFGFRQYPSGARYIGFWSNGKRHGKGVMFWSNNDIYRGDWKEGLMHGYGEYTWRGFVNKSLSYPAGNIYRGQWEEGMRNGVGLLELKTGCLIETVWVNNVKEGYGAVICRNGAVVASELLFVRDKPAVMPIVQCGDNGLPCDISVDFASSKKKFQSEDALAEPSSRTKLVKAICIPINAPVHSLNLSPHTQKFFNQKRDGYLQSNEEAEMKKEFVTLTPQKDKTERPPVFLTEAQQKQLTESIIMEESNLRNFIIFNSAALRFGYDYYAKLACEEPPPFKCTLLRLFLWQLLADGGVPNSNLSLVDIDNLIASEEFLLIHDAHNPFEQIQFWQFLQILILLSWHLYGQYVYGELPMVENKRLMDFLHRFNPCEVNNVLKTGLQYFIENDIFWEGFLESAQPPRERRKFEENDFAPMEAMYRIYCNIGKPHSAREFLKAVFNKPTEDGNTPPLVRYYEKLPTCRVEGKNALTIAGELQHFHACDPFNFPELFELEGNEMMDPKLELTGFRCLGARKVVNSLIEACPGISNDDTIGSMDYMLTFLEFYKVIVLLAKAYLKMKVMDELRGGLIEEYRLKMEAYKAQMAEYEKQKETTAVSRKKSRQAPPDGRKKEKNK